MTTAEIGHNSAKLPSNEQLRSFVERVERLEEEKKSIGEDIRDVMTEAKSNGVNPKALREVIKLRKMEKEKREEHQAAVEAYCVSLGLSVFA